MFGTLCRGPAAVSVAVALGAAVPLSTPLEQLDAALHELAPDGADFTVATVSAEECGPFARARVDRIEIDPAALALVNDRQSARTLADMLSRAEKLGNREASTLSRRVRKDLGKSIYPPDYSCAG
jgi:hypothetical protein